MAKKTEAEIKAEATALTELITTAKKKPMNFAMIIAKEGVAIEGHATKSCDAMWRAAKAKGGGSKGAQGIMNVVGKSVEFTCEFDDFPTSLPRQAKRYIKELGLPPYKIVMILPSGERLDDGEEEEAGAEGATVAKSDDAAESTESESEDEAPGLKEQLTNALKALVPQVRDLSAQGLAAAEKLGRGLQAIAAELKAENLERAQALLAAVEKGVADAGGSGRAGTPITPVAKGNGDGSTVAPPVAPPRPTGPVPTATQPVAPPPPVDQTALRDQLKSEFAAIAGQLEVLKAKSSKEISGKATQVASMFSGLVDGEDLKKAGAVLSLLKTTINSEMAKLAEATGGLMDALGGVVKDIANVADDMIETVTGEHGLSPKEREALTKLRSTDPKAYEAAKAALDQLGAGGEVDTSPDAMQASIEALEAARKDNIAKIAALEAAQKTADAVAKGPQPGSPWANAQLASAQALKAFRDFGASLPPPASMTEKQRQDAMIEGMRLDRLAKEAQANEAAAKKKTEDDAKAALDAAKQGAADAKGKLGDAQKVQDTKDSKKGLMDALSFGRLSPDAKPPFKDEDKASFIGAFAKDGKLANAALDLAARSDDPSVVARNVGMVTDKVKDGFAAADGKKLDLPEEDLRSMGMNALRMGALQGDDYFKGFDSYLKSGKQLAPDPHGGMDAPLDDKDAETQRQNKIALNRSSTMGAAAIGPDGKVDFGSDAAKGAMDHMMFHPGSLKTFTPQMNAKMSEVKGLFADPTSGPKAQGVIDATKLPGKGAPGKVASQKIVAGTMGKKPGEVTDADAKASVLSAMMTPLSQGPVGSCFSTAPVRAVRETDPLRAMDEYSKIASTGQFKGANGKTFPANVNPPKGENPLMRSWEYSVATAAANEKNSIEKTNVNTGVMGLGGGARDGLRGMRDFIPDDEWHSKNDPVTGDLIPGVRAKLTTAISSKLKFEYNAGPPIGVPAGGGGDGSSTDGGYEVMYNGKALKSQADFAAAIADIALKVTGDAKDSDRGKKIIALVNSDDFQNDILKPYGSSVPWSPGDGAPWSIPSGGFEKQTAKVLDGGDPQNIAVIGENNGTPPMTDTARTQAILAQVLDVHKNAGGKGMVPLGTSGDNAAHAFNTLPNHPSLDKIKDPGSAGKIQTELVAPGLAVAAKKLPAEQAARMFEDQLKALAEHAEQDERDLLIAALKNRPTTELKPGELKAKVESESAAYRTAVAQKRADKYVADKEPTADGPRKVVILNFYQDQVKKEVKAAVDTALMASIEVPQVVIADTNWGDPTSQLQFVVAPDPSTGDLMLWRKDIYSGKMEPLGTNWANGAWDTVK